MIHDPYWKNDSTGSSDLFLSKLTLASCRYRSSRNTWSHFKIFNEIKLSEALTYPEVNLHTGRHSKAGTSRDYSGTLPCDYTPERGRIIMIIDVRANDEVQSHKDT